MRTLRTIKILDREGSRIDREKALAHFRDLHKQRTGCEPPEVLIEKREGYSIISVKEPAPEASMQDVESGEESSDVQSEPSDEE